MDSTSTATTTPLPDSHLNLCAAGTSFWTCKLGPFIGCCSHDACHDGYCHDMTPEALDHMSLQNSILKRHVEAESESEMISTSTATTTVTTTVTYTLVRATGSFLGPSSTSSSSQISSTTPDLLAALKPAPKAQTSSPNAIKPNSSSKSNSVLSTLSTTLATATTTSINPTAAPVAGSKKSKRVVAGIALGVVAAVILILLLTYLIIASRRRRNAAKGKSPFSLSSSAARAVKAKVKMKAKKKTKKTRNKKKKNPDEDDEEPQTPMTPGGAKLEEQRGRMLKDSQERTTGYRAVGQTPWNSRNMVKGSSSVPNLAPPLPIVVAGAEIVSARFGVPPVHPAYRGRDEQVIPSPGVTRRFYDKLNGYVQGQSQVESSSPASAAAAGSGQGSSNSNHDVKTVHWTAIDHAGVNSVVPGPLSLRTSEADGLTTEREKPRFDETTSKWAAVTSSGIGHAVSTPTPAPSQNARNDGGSVVAMSTDNEITSPVEKGGLRKPVKRGVYRGFDDMVSGEGKLK